MIVTRASSIGVEWNMFQEERLIEIMRELQLRPRISVQDICDRYGVSRDTARRDLVKLEEQGVILRTRGGAILPSLTKKTSTYEERIQSEPDSKRAIGRRASSLIKDGDYLIMDASTTVRFAAEALQSSNHIVVTNSIDIAGILGERQDVAIHLLGGLVMHHNRYVYGARAIEMLADYQVDKVLIGAHGISAEGISHPNAEECYLLRQMMKRADQVIVLADHTKFGVKQLHRVAGFDQIDRIVTDQLPDEHIRHILQQHDVELVLAVE